MTHPAHDIPAQLQQAIAHHRANRLPMAESLYRLILARAPNHSVALHHLGLILGQRQDFAQAWPLIERSIALEPANPAYRRNFAELLMSAGKVAEASRMLASIPSPAPARESIAALRARATALNNAGRHAEALPLWERVVHAAPADADALFELAFAHAAVGQLEAAMRGYEAVLRHRPDHVGALLNLGILLPVPRWPEAIELLEKADRLRPNLPTIMTSLGVLLAKSRQPGRGLALTEAALAAAPGDPMQESARHWNHAVALRAAGRADEALAATRRAIAHTPPGPLHETLLMDMQYVWPDDPAEQFKQHCQVEKTYLPPRQPRPAPRDRGDAPLRVGLLSSDLRAHSVSRFLEPLLAHHDASRVEFHCFSTHAVVDSMTERLRSLADGWQAIGTLNDDIAAQAVRDAGIDALIDLNGHTAGSRLGIMTRRPAFVQLTYLGYPNTTGLTTIDGRITDAVADPPGPADAFHSETLLRLPNVFAPFQPPDDAPPVSPSPAAVNGFVTLACVGKPLKITGPALAAWGTALARLPADTRLMLVGENYGDPVVRDGFIARLRGAGIDPDRVEFIDALPFDDYLRLHARIDLILDTFPFNGHTTTVQNLWMGVPVLTCAGESHRSRMGASVLSAIGLADLIGNGVDDYTDHIVRYAGDPTALADLRTGMRERMLASPLTDLPRFARDFESLVLKAWERVRATGSLRT